MTTIERITVPVRGGDLTVGVFNPDAAITIIAIHGITASHLAWAHLAEAMPDVRIIAPDLRGRGGSRALPGPWGMREHAADVAAVIRAFDLTTVVIVGHSMGAFVATIVADATPDLVADLVLVDGGLPLRKPALDGVAPADVPLALLGPAAARLAMTFADRESYREFWRAHPALAAEWSSTLDAYVDYDLVGTEPELRSAVVFDAVAEDSLELYDDGGFTRAITATALATGHSVSLLRAPRGLLNDLPALYSPGRIERSRAEIPALDVVEVAGVNHYTIIMTDRGARAVAQVVRNAIESHHERLDD